MGSVADHLPRALPVTCCRHRHSRVAVVLRRMGRVWDSGLAREPLGAADEGQHDEEHDKPSLPTHSLPPGPARSAGLSGANHGFVLDVPARGTDRRGDDFLSRVRRGRSLGPLCVRRLLPQATRRTTLCLLAPTAAVLQFCAQLE